MLHSCTFPPRHSRVAAGRSVCRETFILLSMCSLVLASGVCVSRSLKPRWAEHVEATESPLPLPAGATDVTYNKALRNGYFCEFTCSEDNFRRWIETGEMQFGSKGGVREIQGERRHRRLSLGRFHKHPPEVTVTNGVEFTYGDVAKDGFAIGRHLRSRHSSSLLQSDERLTTSFTMPLKVSSPAPSAPTRRRRCCRPCRSRRRAGG